MQEILLTATAGLPEDEENDEDDGDNSNDRDDLNISHSIIEQYSSWGLIVTGITVRISYDEDPKGKDTLHMDEKIDK
ncbi:hypothetical protein RB213_010426 [Colletotrichum asianum]